MSENMTGLLQRFHNYWHSGHPEDFTAKELQSLEQYFLKHDQHEKLARVLELGIRLFPADPYFMVRHAYLLIETGREDQVEKILKYLELEFPSEMEVSLLRLHQILHSDRHHPGELAAQIQHIIDTYRPLSTSLAGVLFQITKWVYDDQFPTKKWLDRIFEATSQTPADIREYLFSLEDVSLLSGDVEPLFLEAITAFPDDTALMLLYAEYLKKIKKNTPETIDYLRLILLHDPDNSTAHLYLGELLESEGDYDMAIIHYNKVLSLHDPSASIYMRIGVCHEKSGRHTDAESYYQMAVREDPAYLPAWHALIQSYAHNGQLDKAIACNLDAVDNIPNRKLYEMLGYLFLQKKYYPSALKAYEEAFNMGSRDKNVLLILHDLYDQNGDFHLAEKIIRYARWHYPDDSEVRQRTQKYDLW